jgi:small subunit ribosomal protein S17
MSDMKVNSTSITAATPPGARERGTRKGIVGLVVSDKMDKTITVQVVRLEKHTKYKKYLRRHTKYHVHDEKDEAKTGDTVEIQETRPLSKLKRWRLIKVLASSSSGAPPRGAGAVVPAQPSQTAGSAKGA